MHIRNYEERDLNRVLEITLVAWQPVFTSFRSLMGVAVFDIAYPDWKAEKRQQLTSQCEGEHGATTRVAELDGEVVAFIVYYCNAKTGIGEISHNAVDPLFRIRALLPKCIILFCQR